MAAPTSVAQQIETALESLRLMLGDLCEVSADWPQMSDAERASWSLDWDQLVMTDLRLLEQHYRSETMTSGQETEYKDLLGKLTDLLPTIRNMSLHEPPAITRS